MGKAINVVGFLYNTKTQQFLLISDPSQNSTFTWSVFSAKATSEEDAKKAFQQAVFQKVHFKPGLNDINFVYDYFDSHQKVSQHVFFAEASIKDIPASNAQSTFSWFNTKQITKLKLDPQSKHDIVIAQRVMGDIERKNNPVPAEA